MPHRDALVDRVVLDDEDACEVPAGAAARPARGRRRPAGAVPAGRRRPSRRRARSGMTGAVRHASTPASSSAPRREAGRARTTSTTRTPAKRPVGRGSCRATCSPSVPGIWIVEHDDVDRAAAARRPGRAGRVPSAAGAADVDATSPRRAAAPRATRRAAVGRRRRGRGRPAAAAAATRACRRCASRPASSATVNQNVLPRPGSLSTPISPPIASTSCRLMREAQPGAAVLARRRRSRPGRTARTAARGTSARCRCRCR